MTPVVTRLYVSTRDEICLHGRKPRDVSPLWMAVDRPTGLYGIVSWAVPDVLRALERERIPCDVSPAVHARVKRATLLQDATRAVQDGRIPLPKGDVTDATLRPYQREALAFADATMGRYLLALDTGLGKTISSIAAARRLDCDRTLVITRANVKYKWAREIERFDGRASFVANGETPRPIPRGVSYVITNYDIVAPWERTLRAWAPDFVVADEAHRIANRTTKMSGVTKTLLQSAPYASCLSATPQRSRPRDLWNLLDALQPGEWGSKWDFERVYCKGHKRAVTRFVKGKGKKTWLIWVADGVSNEETLHARLRTIMYRRLKREVEKDLPPMARSLHPAALTTEARREYDTLASRMGEALQAERFDDVLSYITLLRQASSVGRVPTTVEYATELLDAEPDRPVVIFAYFLNTLDALQKALKGRRVARIDGSVSPAKRDHISEEFQAGKFDVLLGQVVASGEGIDLFRSDTSLHHDVTWSPFESIQAEGRLDRIGQTRPTRHVYFLAEDTIDERVLNVTMNKLAQAESLLDTGAKVDRELVASLKADYFGLTAKNKARA